LWLPGGWASVWCSGRVRGGSVLSAGVLACGCGGARLLAQSAARGRGGV